MSRDEDAPGAGAAAVLAAVGRINTRLEEITGRLEEYENGLHDLAADVAELGAGPKTGAAARAMWWPYLDRAAATAEWGHLGAWVREVLLPRHKEHSRTLRACWRQHPEVVDELTALRVVWLDAYTNPKCNPTAAADYLRRWLPDAMAAIERYFAAGGCTAGIHSEHIESDHRPGRQWKADEVADFITTDTTGRPQPPAPVPAGKTGNKE